MILASQSPRRRQLLAELGYKLTILPADIDESPLPQESPIELVGRLAREKAEASRARAAAEKVADVDGLLVAADTIVWHEGVVLGKPADAEDARRMLTELSGKTHHVSTGCCVMALDGEGGAVETRTFVETCDVEFWPLTAAQVDPYVATGEPMDKAGAYGIQGVGGRMLVRKIDGDFYNVVGLPIARVVRELHALGA